MGSIQPGTISDVIFHLRYTARDDDALRGAATDSVKTLLALASARPLLRMFSLRHEFPGEWHRFLNAATPGPMTVDLASARFPYFAQGRDLQICTAKVVAVSKTATAIDANVAPGSTLPTTSGPEWSGHQDPGLWTVGTSADPKTIEEMYVIVAYTI